jgi:hypothetical protein
MEVDYQADFEAISDANKLMHKVVNSNYKGDPRSINITTPFVFDKIEIIDYQKSDFYKELNQQAVDFIDRDEKKLDEAINSFIDLRFNYRIRYAMELPVLLRDAKSIINILEKNYLADDIKSGKIKRYQSKELLTLMQEGKTIDYIIDVIKSDDIKDQIYDTSRNGINKLGYNLMKQNNTEALKIFKLNTELYYDWFTMDSYGEGLLKIGDTLNAIKAYTTSLQLNPNNIDAQRILEGIK